MSSTILEYKANGAKTSEQLFGITKQPNNNCPIVDNNISGLKQDIRDIIYGIRHLDREMPDESDLKSIESDVSNLDTYIDGFNELRDSCSGLRAWGEEWKEFAKQLFELLPKEQQEMFVQDEFLNV